jgi:DNA-binding NarL/FixJ family response regulator
MKTSVVIVEDHQLVREGLESRLKKMKEIDMLASFPSQATCIEWFANNCADILVSDIYLNGANCVNLIRRLKKDHPSLKIILISGHFFPNFDNWFLKDAVQGVWDKVEDVESFCELLLNVVETPIQNVTSGSWSSGVLTLREEEICIFLAQGFSVRLTAEKLDLSPKTIEAHKANIMSKLGVKNQNELVKWSIQEGLIIP